MYNPLLTLSWGTCLDNLLSFFQFLGARCLEEYIQHNELSKDRFPRLEDFTLNMHSMFGNTYMCESTYFGMKQVKSKNRNQMAEETLGP